MGKALYCPFYTCKVEYYTYCPMHHALLPCIREVVTQLDPEGILSFNVNVANLLPMVKMLEEQYRVNKRLERQLRHYETEMQRLEGGR